MGSRCTSPSVGNHAGSASVPTASTRSSTAALRRPPVRSRRREPRTLVRLAGLGASAELEAQLAQPYAVHVAGGCSNTTVTFSNPSKRSSASAAARVSPHGAAVNGSSPLRANRDFRLLWVGQTLSTLGGRISGVAFPLLVLATTGSPTKAGLAGLVANAPFVLLQLPAGAYVDRWNRRAVMPWADVGRAAAIGSLAMAIAFDRLTYPHILVVATVEGSLFVVFRLAEAAALRQVVPKESQLADAIALNQARVYGTSLAGEPLGGLLFGVRTMLPFAADAVSYLASLVTIAAIRTPLPGLTTQRSVILAGRSPKG